MAALFRISALICLISILALPCLAKEKVPSPLPGEIPSQWSPVDGAQGVQYAPGQSYDIFRYTDGYYCLNQGKWYRKADEKAPWSVTVNIPQVFFQVQSGYFKYPPGWAKGRKAGWSGAPVPPGQLKKNTGTKGAKVPPGQVK
ncbi:MAG: hypothetical protein RDV48_22910 [Candidatus Eremiobacteraeota bacterium]|nr:hypothetical protein [Candidatus Eremiobacteraeota bacterium]